MPVNINRTLLNDLDSNGSVAKSPIPATLQTKSKLKAFHFVADQDGDKTGGINRLFRYFYALRLQAKALKERNNPLYQTLKWGIFALVVIAIILL